VLFKKERDGVISPFAFVCFENTANKEDKEYGPKCAMNAIKDLHEQVIDGCKIYVREALKKADRDQENRNNQMRFKNSKKRCNLYVKNFPPNTKEPELREFFGKCGEIESVKIFSKEGEAVYAFVCYKSPDAAALAKQQLHQQTFNGKQLYINHYEIKEIRKIQQEEIRDKADFNNYKKQNQGSLNLDIINKPEIFALIQQLIMYMQRSQPSFKQGMGPYQNRGPRQPRPHQ
jgi:RNA recognition motif-containing protein